MDTPGGTAVLRAVPSQHNRLGINRLLRCVAVLNKSRSHAQCNIVCGGSGQDEGLVVVLSNDRDSEK